MTYHGPAMRVAKQVCMLHLGLSLLQVGTDTEFMPSTPALRGHNLLQDCPDTVLAVDLDETLVQVDVLRSGMIRALRQAPLSALPLLWGLLRGGRPGLKRAVARIAPVTPDTLPYNPAVLDLIAAWRAAGRKVVLASAADETVALAVAAHLGLFDAVHASRPDRNLKGRTKAAFLVSEYGAQGFVYAGDSRADLHVWQQAAGAALARNDKAISAAIRALGIPLQCVSPPPPRPDAA